jgi:hypothetical protein
MISGHSNNDLPHRGRPQDFALCSSPKGCAEGCPKPSSSYEIDPVRMPVAQHARYVLPQPGPQAVKMLNMRLLHIFIAGCVA